MMKKSFLYLLLAVMVLSAMFMLGGRNIHADQGDNVTYTLPYLTTATDKNIYCIISNQTQDNASVHFTITANSALNLTSQLQNFNTLSNYAVVYAHQS
ncbi:MAG: hypothetical protein HQK96_21215, partial [Nitrospirae bacterium]|nr:hypothetical protein [Nitrospirota bacterium]